MSWYVRHKVLRIPQDKLNMSVLLETVKEKFSGQNIEDDLWCYIEQCYPELVEYAEPGKFYCAPTCEAFVDLMIERETDCDGNWGKVRNLYETEKKTFEDMFKKLDPNVNMDDVKLVEFCWYNATEAPSYFDITKDKFYEEVTGWQKRSY